MENTHHIIDMFESRCDPNQFEGSLSELAGLARGEITQFRKDKERLDWLLNKGLAWRDCYVGDWQEGEWLYREQGGREAIDKAKGGEHGV